MELLVQVAPTNPGGTKSASAVTRPVTLVQAQVMPNAQAASLDASNTEADATQPVL